MIRSSQEKVHKHETFIMKVCQNFVRASPNPLQNTFQHLALSVDICKPVNSIVQGIYFHFANFAVKMSRSASNLDLCFLVEASCVSDAEHSGESAHRSLSDRWKVLACHLLQMLRQTHHFQM